MTSRVFIANFMKKAILHLIFLGLLFSNSQAHAVAFLRDAKVKIAIHKICNENTTGHGVSKRSSFSHKADLLNDFEDDCDDCDNQDTSVKGKLYAASIPCFNSNQLTSDYSCKTFCNRIYYHVNFSRLPRFNYISLRVLRL